jgi:hypothetical protein
MTTAYTTSTRAMMVMILPFLPAGLLSIKGRKKNRIPASNIKRTARVSPLMNKILAGKIFRVWNRKRKYHSGFIPSGAGAIKSAALSREGGKKMAKEKRIPRSRSQTIISR